MSIGAIIFMVISLSVLWGGLAFFLSIAVRKK